MSEMVEVIRASDGEAIIVDVDTAKTMFDAGELTTPESTEDPLSIEDVYGEDYENVGLQ